MCICRKIVDVAIYMLYLESCCGENLAGSRKFLLLLTLMGGLSSVCIFHIAFAVRMLNVSLILVKLELSISPSLMVLLAPTGALYVMMP